MTTSARDRPAALDLSREESWVVHTALLAAIERAHEADEAPAPAPDLLARVEAGDSDFDEAELDYLAEVLRAYLDAAPDRDRSHVTHVLTHIEAVNV